MIEHTLSNFIEEHFPEEVTNWKGDKGRLVIERKWASDENNKDYPNWLCIKYEDKNGGIIESKYRGGYVYLVSFEATDTEAVIDMADKLISGGLIK